MAKKLSTQEKARRLWVRALRSGKYNWGKRALRTDDNKYCCLGVLCELAIKQGVISRCRWDSGTLSNYPKVMKWVGLEEDDGDFGAHSLVHLNDDANRNPFKKIARLIEKKPDGLFVDDGEV